MKKDFYRQFFQQCLRFLKDTHTIDTRYAASNEEQRLRSTLQYLSGLSQTLAAGLDFNVALEHICSLSVPAIFSGMHIAIRNVDGEPNFDVMCGTTFAASTFSVSFGAEGQMTGTVSVWAERMADDIDRMLLVDVVTRLETACNVAQVMARQRYVADTLQRAFTDNASADRHD